MSLNIKGYIQALDLSGKHMRFTHKHRAYSPSPTVYNAGNGFDDFELVVLHQLLFSDKNEDPIDTSLLSQLYDITQWLIDQSVNGELTTNTPASNTAIGIAFNSETVVVTLGPTTEDTNSRILPEWVSVVIGDNTFKFWLLDTALETQYQTRQYLVAKTLPNTDSFYTSSKNGLTTILAPYLNSPYKALSQVTENAPVTRVVEHTEQWIEQANNNNVLDVTFLIAVYGPGTVLPEELRDALREHLLDGSSYESGAWETIFPGIFQVSTFDVIPAFNNLVDGSIPQYYNNIVNVNEYLPILEDATFNYTPDWAKNNIQSLPTVYQSLLCLVVPNENNDLSKLSFATFFPDYILANSLDPDYIRMSTLTRKLVDYLMAVLPVAEGIVNTIPNGVTEELANGARWYRFTVGEVQLRIISKTSLTSIV